MSSPPRPVASLFATFAASIGNITSAAVAPANCPTPTARLPATMFTAPCSYVWSLALITESSPREAAPPASVRGFGISTFGGEIFGSSIFGSSIFGSSIFGILTGGGFGSSTFGGVNFGTETFGGVNIGMVTFGSDGGLNPPPLLPPVPPPEGFEAKGLGSDGVGIEIPKRLNAIATPHA